MLSPPRGKPKLYIPQPDGPRFRSTYNFDMHTFPQVVSKESRDALPTKGETEVIYSTARRPRLQIYLQFGPACVSASRNEKILVKWRSGDVFSTTDDDKCYRQPVDPQVRQPPSGGIWFGSTCDVLKSLSKLYLKSLIKHDRLCHEMSEADGVDGGAIFTWVLHITNLLISLKHPKRKGISNANFRVESPLARGSPSAATS
ncbi:hypothetical protein HZH68_014073 [Vespula germanica]|uniref:Uncharacterized protein n=1 Tax=Vespula germanica TaxID=30212 RepID=A0A834JBD0_VESGE|nr:hypothetical protein HZH68_014073 [Vespula germanica]